MSQAKELLIKNTELRDRLIAVTASDWWKEAMMYVKAHAIEQMTDPADLSGMRLFEHSLMTISDSQYVAPEPLRCKLNHAIDNPRVSQPKA